MSNPSVWRFAALLLMFVAGVQAGWAMVDGKEVEVRRTTVPGVAESCVGAFDLTQPDALVWRSEGHTVEAVDFELFDYIVPAYYVLTTAEASSNLARFDGVRYGYRAEGGDLELTEFYKRARSEGFGREVKRRILLATFVVSAG